MKKPVVLRIYKGEQLLGVKQFVNPQIVIGQPSDSGEVQVGLEGDSVSILHASIEDRDGTYFVSDLGSAVGTLKNGNAVLDEAIESGDTLVVGDYKIEFYIGAPKPKGAATSTKPAEPSVNFTAPETPLELEKDPEPSFVGSMPTVPPVPANIFDSIAVPKLPVETATPIQPEPPKAATPPPPEKKPEPPASPIAAAPVEAAPQPAVNFVIKPETPPATPPSPPEKKASPVTAAAKQPEKSPEKSADKPAEKVVVKPVEKPVQPPAQKINPVTNIARPPGAQSAQGANQQVPPPRPQNPANRKETGSGTGLEAGGRASPNSGMPPGMAGGGLVGPKSDFRSPARGHKGGAHKKGRNTFAPPSKFNDVKEYVKPSKGTVVEVLVVWGSRVISNHHFSQSQTVTVGSHPDNDIIVPLLSSQVRKLPIVKIEGKAIVLITPEMRGEVVRGQTSSSFAELMRQNRMARVGNSFSIGLEQGEMARIEITEELAVIIRYVSDSPKPLVAPVLDLTASEMTGVVLALALVATLWLYMYLYSPPKPLDDQDEKQPDRTAVILLAPPTPPPLPPPPPPTPIPQPTPEPTPVPTPVATPPPQKIKVAEKAVVAQVKKAPTVDNLTKKIDNGKSASAAPNKNKTGPRIQTSVKQGGAIKTTPKEGAQMQSKSKDVSHAGMFSVFGNNGAQDKLAQSTTGSGELAGMANAANGKAGSAVDRAGQGLGSELKDTGMGGNGKALDGIAGGVGTTGRGSGNAGYGTGGLGNHQGAKIVTGGAGEDIRGTIDREAIRRVIRANLSSIRACYEKELNRHPDLMGKIVLTWEIGEQGRVLSASTKSNELGNKDVADCITEKLKTWRFPEPPANTTAEVSYPFLFSN